MKILITGWAWFVGSHFAHYCISKWDEVVVIDDLSWGFTRNLPSTCTFYQTDICDTAEMARIFDYEKPEYVYHFAAYAAEGLSHFIRHYNYMNNLIGSVNIINECIKNKVKKIIFTSSMAVYWINETPFRENMQPCPEDPYGIAKYSVEQDLKLAKEMFGLDYTIFRPHNIVWINQNISDSYRNVVGIFINQVMNGKPMTIFGDGSQMRAFSYIWDMMPYFYKSMARGNWEIYNIWGEVPYTINELVSKILEYMPEWEFVNEPPRVEVHTAYSDHSKLYNDFGRLSELTPIEKWLPEFILRCKEIWPQECTKFDWVEIEDKLPPKWKALLSK